MVKKKLSCGQKWKSPCMGIPGRHSKKVLRLDPWFSLVLPLIRTCQNGRSMLYISAIFVLFIVFLYVAASIHRPGIGHS